MTSSKPLKLSWRAISVATLASWSASVSALDVRLLDATKGQPLKDSILVWRLGAGVANTVTANANGEAGISLPATASGPLRITGQKRGFASMTMVWEARNAPAKFDLLLPEAQRVGGRVLDESGHPVVGADVTLTVPQRLAGPSIVVEDPPLKSDSDGRWNCDAVPKDIAFVYVEVSHPDYLPSEGHVTLEALRDGTAEHKLFSAATVRGHVVDAGGEAIPDGEVVLGSEQGIWPGSGTSEARTDAKGVFEFRRIALGKRLLGVKAATAAAPALQLIEVKPGLPLIEVRLTRGVPLRVRVVDAAGQPIPEVRATVEEWPSSAQSSTSGTPGRWLFPGWEWRTDADGRFVWSNAPPDTASWTFSKGGFMSRGHHGVKPSSEEQVIALGPAFRISGRVTDARSGQPVPDFILTPRFVEVSVTAGTTVTNFGQWAEYNRKPCFSGQFSLYFEHPLLIGTMEMHDWQFRIEADGYAAAVSRVVQDKERGLQLDFPLASAPLPDFAVAAPQGKRRVTAGAAFQPARARAGEIVTLFVKTRIAAGHHIYALEDSGCSNLPTSLDASLPHALQPDGPWRGPVPKVQADGSRTLAGDLLFRRRFLVERNSRAETHKVPVKVRFQVCNEALCWPPENILLETELEVLYIAP